MGETTKGSAEDDAVARAVCDAWKSIPTGLSTPSEQDAPWLWGYFREAARDEQQADRLANVAAAQVIAWWDEEGEATAFRRIREAVGDPPANAKHAAQYACDIVGSLLREAFAPIPHG